MAQLAQCPACNCEVLIPDTEATGASATDFVECPACDEVFSIADAEKRPMLTAKAVVRPKATTATPTVTTLDSFLSDRTDEKRLAESDELESDADDSLELSDHKTIDMAVSPGHATLADFQKSLDELIGRTKPEAEVAKSEAIESDVDSPVEDDYSDTISEEKVEAKDDIQPIEMAESEPSPANDRLRPTFAELFGGGFAQKLDDPVEDEEEAIADESPVVLSADSGTFEPMMEETEIARSVEATKETIAEDETEVFRPAVTPVLATSDFDEEDFSDTPTFDFEVGGSTDDETKSLRAAMGFGADALLEVENHELADLDSVPGEKASPELSFAGMAEAPRGVVATRRRSSGGSAMRTLVGVGGGGVAGLVGGYLVLLWILHSIGRTDDPLGFAQYFPNVVKPTTFQSSVDNRSDNSLIAANDENADSNADPSNDESLDTLSSDEAPMSDVERANFETPAATEEPAPLSELEVSPAREVKITDAPVYPAAVLQEATVTTQGAVEGLLSGKFEDAAIRPIKGGSYATIAKLADALTFGEGSDDVSWKKEARRQFPQLFATEQSRQEVSLIAGYWLMSDKRGHGGIFFSGKPDAGRQQGSVAEYVITLPAGQTITVLTPQALQTSTASAPTIAVVGSVIDNPTSRIDGYTGTATQAVWSRDVFPVGD